MELLKQRKTLAIQIPPDKSLKELCVSIAHQRRGRFYDFILHSWRPLRQSYLSVSFRILRGYIPVFQFSFNKQSLGTRAWPGLTLTAQKP